MGYAYFKSKDYKQAADVFERLFISKTDDKELKHDAMLRLADSNYRAKNIITP
ncbi:MAG: tetratricopeptide repeat protein [Flavobacteriales bacterium Tduv]